VSPTCTVTLPVGGGGVVAGVVVRGRGEVVMGMVWISTSSVVGCAGGLALRHSTDPRAAGAVTAA